MMMISLTNCQIGTRKKKPVAPHRKSSVKSSRLEKTARGTECELCGYKGRDREKLARHQKTHSKLLKRNPCHICHYSFKSLDALNHHIASYHTDGCELTVKVEDEDSTGVKEVAVESTEVIIKDEEISRKFDCKHCDSSFIHKNHLTRHLATHSGVLHQCSQCDSTFSRKDKLNAHIRKKHSTTAGGNKGDKETDVLESIDENIEATCEELI